MLLISIFSISTTFCKYMIYLCIVVCKCFNLDKSSFLSSCKELTDPKAKKEDFWKHYEEKEKMQAGPISNFNKDVLKHVICRCFTGSFEYRVNKGNSMAFHIMHQLMWANCSQWVKTERGWQLQQLADVKVDGARDGNLSARSELCLNNREVSQSRNIRVNGMKGQRRMTVSLSEFIEYFDLKGASLDIRRKAYLHNFMYRMIEKHILRVSGTSHRQLFKILESMFNEAIQSEYMIGQMKLLLVQTMVTLRTTDSGLIGSRRLWNRHQQNVSNMCTKMEQFTYREREDDGQLTLTDLPKECILDIILRLSDHKDILHLGQTCWYLNDLIQDPQVWEKLTQYHFSEKQMMVFVDDTGDLGEYSAWQHLYKSCFKKYGFSGTHMYTDKPVICSACKTLHWMMLGHNCWSNEDGRKQASLEPISPEELLAILPL